jgi:two-component system, sporulation sensor kinase B
VHLYRELLIDALFHVLALAVAARLIEEIIERQQMREEIIRTEKLNTMADLAGSFAHEVRNPLTVVKGFIQLMHKEADGKDRDYLTLTLSEVGRAEMIISNYLSFAKPEFNKIEEFNYKKLLEEIIALLEPLAAKEGVIIEGKLAVDELYYASDRSQVKQAIVNLVKNAIEATSQGGKVILSLDMEDGQARIGIRDNGRGMTEEQISRIGTLFYTTKDRGTGLGTTVAIGIIQAMKGNIQFESEEGRGTEVTLKLPIKKTAYVSETKMLSILKG